MNIAYVRVSTAAQNEARQVEALEKYNIEKWYTEKVSGKDMNRPQLNEMINFAREGDTVYIHDFSRIARSTKDLLTIVELFEEKKINFVSLKENIESNTPTGKLMLTMIAAINEFERSNLLDRQQEGIEIAQRQGKFKGRKAKKVNEAFVAAYNDYLARKINKTQLAQKLGISRTTLYKLIENYEDSKEGGEVKDAYIK